MKGCTIVLRRLSTLTSIDYSTYVRAHLIDVYNKYEEKIGAFRLRRIVRPNLV